MQVNDNPRVSIIIPNFNRAHLIQDTLNSIIKQTYNNWEVIVVDDGSTDKSLLILNEFVKKDKRIKFLLRHREPKGAPTCRNIGFEHSSGDYIIFLDSDDILAHYCLKTRVEYITKNVDCDFLVFPMLVFINEPGDSFKLWNINTNKNDLERFLETDIPWSVTGPIWKKKALIQIGKWDEEALSWQDWEFHLKALSFNLKYKKIDVLPDCFVRRSEEERISKNMIKKNQLYSRFSLFVKVYENLNKNCNLTQTEKQKLGRLFFDHAEKCAIYIPEEKLSLTCINKLVDLSLLPKYVSFIALLYINLLMQIKAFRLPFLSTITLNLFHFILPAYLVRNNSKILKVDLDAKNYLKLKSMLNH